MTHLSVDVARPDVVIGTTDLPVTTVGDHFLGSCGAYPLTGDVKVAARLGSVVKVNGHAVWRSFSTPSSKVGDFHREEDVADNVKST
jgi:hypothetical protein